MADALDFFISPLTASVRALLSPSLGRGQHGVFPPPNGAGKTVGFGDVRGLDDVVEVGQRVAGGVFVAGAVDRAQLLLSVIRPSW